MNPKSLNNYQKLQRDPLTGLFTRASANQIIKSKIDQFENSSDIISVALLDIDRFESFDERYGLTAGDALLKTVTEVLVAANTGADAVSRYSRDTFLLIFPKFGPEDTLLATEKVRSFFDTNSLVLNHGYRCGSYNSIYLSIFVIPIEPLHPLQIGIILVILIFPPFFSDII